MLKSERREQKKEAARKKQPGFSQHRKVLEQQKFGENTAWKLHQLSAKKRRSS